MRKKLNGAYSRQNNFINRPWLKVQRDMVQLPNGRVYDEYYVFLVLHGLM
ncbi:hypothetical protein SAMN05444364_11250 [Prevotella scopos JCM 17725]|uniref:Transposase n=1 Tax=Prevotella scopos JCM 17725 TaxID=1236518 RepID=A0AAX2F421_9BACT|nr:hypothetical protein SAMN05444364_11250 [Prevotella scopos JCM 17725]